MASQKVWKRRPGQDLKVAQTCVTAQYLAAKPITLPPTDVETIKTTSDRITLSSFTPSDAWTLGHILYSLLSPLAFSTTTPTPGDEPQSQTISQPCVISISTSNTFPTPQIIFQCVTGPGTTTDHQTWVERKRRAVLRWGCSTYLLGGKFEGDEEKFRKIFAMGEDEAGRYCIHGGGVPIYVEGVEGVVGVVVVSGLSQEMDHGVVFDALREGWE